MLLLAAACAARAPAPDSQPAPHVATAPPASPESAAAPASAVAPDAGAAETDEERAKRLAAELDQLEMTPIGSLSASGGAVGAFDGGAAPASPPPKGSAQVGAPSGASDVANAARVVAGMRAGFRRCFVRALEQDGSLQGGGVKITIEVDATGAVTRATATSTGNMPATALRCMEARARAAAFDPPTSGKALITVPLTFTAP